jgi:hypothetical protein
LTSPPSISQQANSTLKHVLLGDIHAAIAVTEEEDESKYIRYLIVARA